MISLMFMRMHLFAVNSPYAEPSERAFCHWCSTIFYTSIQSSTMLANKRNMVMEAITICFFAVCGDVSQLHQCTLEGNEHSFGSL